MSIFFDPTNMFVGISKTELRKLQPKLKFAQKKIKHLQISGEQGFFDLPFDTVNLKKIEKLAKEVQKKFSRLIVIGIGGSDLGARAIWQACPGNKMELRFLSNPDPDTVSEVLNLTAEEWKKTALNIVSKSGSTLETMSNFLVARDRLIKVIGKDSHKAHIYITTDPGSKLESWGLEQGYKVLEHPKNVGGRFSVLSIVGLFPVACGGVRISEILAGAREVSESEAAKFAVLNFLAYQKGKKIQVLMPYADRLLNFSFWYRQLWAESLGKDGIGPTPLTTSGAVDQHSQIQLFNDGPNDKSITFIKVEKFFHKLKVPKGFPGLEFAAEKDFAEILHAELLGTAEVLTKKKRLNNIITVPNLSPKSIGALLQFFILATAYSGELYGVNTYNQPGVEEGKRIAREELVRMTGK